jgi:hypothetical protein
MQRQLEVMLRGMSDIGIEEAVSSILICGAV